MLYIQEMPAQTVNYLISGFVVIFGVMGIYIASLIVRTKNLRQDYALLIENSDQSDEQSS